MKNQIIYLLSIILYCTLLPGNLFSQEFDGNKLLIPNYQGTAAIIIEPNNQLKIQKGEKVQTVGTKTVEKHLYFLNNTDKNAAISLLNIESLKIPIKYYDSLKDSDVITALINI